MFPALCQFYEMTVGSLSPDQTEEFVRFIEHQKVCVLPVACVIAAMLFDLSNQFLTLI
jgi:hypothetical protein